MIQLISDEGLDIDHAETVAPYVVRNGARFLIAVAVQAVIVVGLLLYGAYFSLSPCSTLTNDTHKSNHHHGFRKSIFR